MWKKIRLWIAGPESRFHKGESVKLKNGGPSMVVVRVYRYREIKEPLIECKWYDTRTQENRKSIFIESNLLPSNHITNKF